MPDRTMHDFAVPAATAAPAATVATAPPMSGLPLPRVRRAVLIVDLVESVRLMQAHEDAVILRWQAFLHGARTDVLPRHAGRLVKSLGDGLLMVFTQVAQASACAFDLLGLMARGNRDQPIFEPLFLRAGLHVCDLVDTELDVFGQGVNLSARLAGLARPGELVVSADARDRLVPGLDGELQDLGECFLKHLEQPVRAFRLGPPAPAQGRAPAPGGHTGPNGAAHDGAGATHLAATQAAAAVAVAAITQAASTAQAAQAAQALGPLSGPGAPAALMPRVLVLPLVAAPGQALSPELMSVITDDLVVALAAEPGLQVVSRLSVQALAGERFDTPFGQASAIRGPAAGDAWADPQAAQPADRQTPPTRLARLARLARLDALIGADFQVHGELRPAGARLSLRLQLLERGRPVWDGEVSAPTDTLLDPERALAPRAAQAIARAILARGLQGGHEAALPNVPGYALFLQAVTLLHRLSRADVDRAERILEHLAERHPRAPEVQAWIAKWHFLQVAQSVSPDRTRSMQRARQAIGQALGVQPTQGLALTLHGHLHAFEDRNPAMAEAHLKAACEASPNEPLAWLFLANLQATIGAPEAAVASLARGQGLSPLDPMAYTAELMASIVHSAAGHTAQALHHAERSVALNALHLSGLIQLIFAQADAGHWPAARRTAKRYLHLRPAASVQRFITHHFAPDTAQFRRQVETLRAVGMPE